MIVPGEASESDEDQPKIPTTSSDLPSANFSLPNARFASGQSILASQLSSKVQSMTEVVSKQLGSLSRQATVSAEEDLESSQNPLVQRLVEKNRSLKESIDNNVENTIGKVPKDLSGILSGCTRTQIYFQDTVLSMQQANHFCAEVIESMDDFMDIGNQVKFPR